MTNLGPRFWDEFMAEQAAEFRVQYAIDRDDAAQRTLETMQYALTDAEAIWAEEDILASGS